MKYSLWMYITLIIIVVLFAATVPVLFVVDGQAFDSVNVTLHNKISFDDLYRGTNPESKVTFVAFKDFTCPACAQQYPIMRKLMKEYPQVNFIYKHSIDPRKSIAVYASKAFECAKQQNYGYELGDYMYTNSISKLAIVEYLDEALDLDVYYKCLEEPLISQFIEGDIYQAAHLNVRGTPTTFINGIRFEGVHTYDVYAAFLDKELASVEVQQ